MGLIPGAGLREMVRIYSQRFAMYMDNFGTYIYWFLSPCFFLYLPVLTSFMSTPGKNSGNANTNY